LSALTGKYLQECLKKYPRFQLIHMVAKRANELQQGAKPLVISRDPSVVEVALEEIASGKIVPTTTQKVVEQEVFDEEEEEGVEEEE
jgi:DNA-directed RNA polymerase omega subunit